MEAVERSSGWWLGDVDGASEGPFIEYQDLCDFYIRMDYESNS